VPAFPRLAGHDGGDVWRQANRQQSGNDAAAALMQCHISQQDDPGNNSICGNSSQTGQGTNGGS
jgi:hypothetical protein